MLCDSQPGDVGGEGSCPTSSPEESPMEPRFLCEAHVMACSAPGYILPQLYSSSFRSECHVLGVGWEGKEEIKEEEGRGGGGKTQS